jgi:hypothetical protein
MREILKELILLQDHLFHPAKRCTDCIRKHFITIEALAEECVTLCRPEKVLEESRDVATKVRSYHTSWEWFMQKYKNKGLRDAFSVKLANKLRLLRKKLQPKFAALPLNKLPAQEQKMAMGLVRSAKP